MATAGNLEIQEQILKLQQQLEASVERQRNYLNDQVSTLNQVLKVRQQITDSSETDESQLEQVTKAIEQAIKKTEEQGTATEKAKRGLSGLRDGARTAGFSFRNLATEFGNWSNKLAVMSVAEQAMIGFGSGLKLVYSAFKSVASVGSTVLESIKEFAISVITFPFKILQGLIDMASSGGSNELAQALEDIRTQFGYLNKTAGGALVSLGRSMKGELANTGLSVYRIFGNLAERLKYLLEYAKNLGPVFTAVSGQIGEGGAEALGAYNKALGLTAEGQKAIAVRALASGRSVNEINRQVANYALQLSSSFGMTMKEVSRDIGDMMANFEAFGHLAPKELAQVSVYSRRLGIEVKALAEVMNKSFNFEDAATQAAQLSQAFGINIDAMKQIQEQDPGKKLDNLRKAFFAAGRSVENMTAQERRLLSQQTGLDAASLDLAFSLKSQSLSYDEVQRKGDAARRKQLTQAEAMQKLAGAIERLIKSGSLPGGGFLDKFLAGINTGIVRSRDWRHLMINLRKDLWETYRAGIRVGRFLVDSFPGVKDVFGSIAEFFNPQRFRSMLGRVVDAFKQFFRDLTEGKTTALPQLLKKLQENFFDFFRNNSPQGLRFLQGTQTFFKAFANIANSAIKLATEKITQLIPLIVDVLMGRRTLAGAIGVGLGGAGAGTLGFLAPLWTALTTGLQTAVAGLYDVLKAGVKELWEVKLWPWLKDQMAHWALYLIAPAIGLSLARGLATAFIAAFAKAAAEAVASRTVTSAVTRLFGQATSSATGAVGTTASQAVAVNAASSTATAADTAKVGPGSLAKLGLVAGFVAIGMAAMAVAIIALRKYNVTKEEVTKAAVLMLGITPLVAVAGGLATVLSGIPVVALKNAGAGLLLIAGFVTIASAQALLLTTALKENNITLADVAVVSATMGAISAFYLASAGIAAIAGIIGGIMVATKGLAVLAIIAGVATLGTLVEAMTRHAMIIMDKINKFRINPGFETKIAGFVSVMNVTVEFVRNIGPIIRAASDVSDISSDTRGMVATMGSITNFIDAVGNQMKSLVDKLVAVMSNLTQEQVQRGQGFAAILTAVGGLIRGMMPPVQALEGNAGVITGLISLNTVPETIENLSRFVGTIMGHLVGPNGLLPKLQQVLTALSATPTEGISRASEAFARILNSVSGFFGALLSPQTIGLVRDMTGTQIDRFNAFFLRIRELVSKGLFNSVLPVIDKLSEVARNIPSANIPGLSSMANIVAELIRSVVGIITALRGSGPITPASVAAINSIQRTMAAVFASMGPWLETTMNSLNRLAATIPTAQVARIRSLLGVVSELVGLVRTIQEVVRTSQESSRISGGSNPFTTAATSITSMVDAFTSRDLNGKLRSLSQLTIPRGLSQKMREFRTIFEALGSLPAAVKSYATESVGSITQIRNQFAEVTGGTSWTGVTTEAIDLQMRNVGGLVYTFNRKIVDLTTQLNTEHSSEKVDQLINTTRTVGYNRISGAVRAMVRDINTVSMELARIPQIDLRANLQTLAGNLGLGETQNFAINRGAMNLNIHLEVNMRADQVESVLVDRVASNIAVINGYTRGTPTSPGRRA